MAYSFQGNSRRQPDASHPDFVELKKNLALKKEDESLDSELLLLVTHFHNNISWYRTRITRDQKRQKRFFVFSLVLLLMIPITVFGLTQVGTSSHSVNEASRIAAQLTAVFTGLIAFHNILREWFVGQNGITSFHEASSNLQSRLYTFEDDWKTLTPEQYEDFKNAIKEEVTYARGIVAKEQKLYFQRMANFPVIDLGAVLSTAGKTAAGFVTQHRGTQTEREIAHAEATDAVKTREALVAGYETSLRNKKEALKEAHDEETKTALKTAISAELTAKKQAEVELIKALAELAKYSHQPLD
ncbi:MAG: hypothetical protein D3910_08150 [Candidatus Electrothrix sp. ATG2]|nr:hypothetical protein [Candidatus Electrothrix sp. ATG2]